MDNFNCPITMEKFTYPVIVPNCGHTFDLQSIIKLVKCPLCNTIFLKNPNEFLLNWVVISFLDLKISVKNNVKKMEFNIDNSLNNIIDDIQRQMLINQN